MKKMIFILKIAMKVMTIQLMTKNKKILTNYQNDALCITFFSCNLDYGWYILKHKIFITWNNYLKCHNYEIITWNNYWSWMIYFVKWNNYLKCHHITDGFKSVGTLTATPTALSLSALHREFENNYLKCHHITDGHTDGLKSIGIA
jgi:hypothetical protein